MTFRRILLLFVFLELLILFIGWWQDGISISSLQTITRFSGRLSLIVFSLIFMLYQKPDQLANWLSPKYYLIFAIVHVIHLIELLAYIFSTESKIIPLRLAGGILGYALIVAMPLLHDYFINNRISPFFFKIAESIFVYYIWFIFFMTYLPRVQGKLPGAGGSYVEHVALLAWVCALLGFKVSNVLLSRQQASRR